MPEPPRACKRYSLRSVFLPNPFSLAVNTTCPFPCLAVESRRAFFAIISQSTISSVFFNRIACTPCADLPILRVCDSRKRMLFPLRVTNIISSPVLTKRTQRRRSPLSRVTAIMPDARTSLKSESGVFLIIPRVVTITSVAPAPAFCDLVSAIIEVICSPR